MRSGALRGGIVIVAFLVQLGTSHAETIAIDGGAALVDWPGGFRNVRSTMTGADAQFDILWSAATIGPYQQCSRSCAPGDLLNLSTLVWNDIIQTPPVENGAVGTATVNGTTYQGIAFGGSLSFDAVPIVLPPVDAVTGDAVRYSSPFSMTGTLQGYQVLGVRDPRLLFTAQLFGSGTVSGAMLLNPNTQTYSFAPLRYTFEPTAPTPEPGTLLMVGSSLVIVARRLRRR